MTDSFLRNCQLIARATDEPLFRVEQDESGEYIVIARLDGYAIVPVEQYRTLCDSFTNQGAPVSLAFSGTLTGGSSDGPITVDVGGPLLLTGSFWSERGPNHTQDTGIAALRPDDLEER